MPENPEGGSWNNPNSRWRRRMRLKWLLLFGGAVLMLLAAAGSSLVPISMLRDGDFVRLLNEWWVAAIVWMPVVVFLLLAAFFFAGGVRARRLERLIPAHEGRICPWCRRVMKSADRGTGDDSQLLGCDACQWQCRADALAIAWVNYVLDQTSFGEWWLENHPKRDGWLRRWQANCRAVMTGQKKKSLRGWALGGLFLLAWLAVLWLLGIGLYQLLFIATILVTFGLVLEAFIREKGQGEVLRRCAGCDYQLVPGQSGAGQCPECAEDWSRPGTVYTTREASASRRAQIAAFAWPAFFFIVVFLVIGPFGLHTKYLPTPSLINEVATGRGFLYTEWDVLLERELSEQQRLTLAGRLFERRDQRATLERKANEWFITEIQAGRLPSEIADRFYGGLISTRLLAPEQVSVGEEITIGIENINQYQDPLIGAPQPAIFFAGFEIDDGAEMCCRAEQIVSITGFGTRVVAYGMLEMGWEGLGPSMDYTPARPGTVTVRARYWIAGLPAGGAMGGPIQWNDDGSPAFPDGTAWSYEQVLEHTIEVVE